jgi:(2Fe-2S) ferredoxin
MGGVDPMEPCRLHVFFCRQQKPGGLVCCGARGAAESLAALQKEIIAQGLDDEVQVTACDSIGMCGRGPNLVVYPEGLWYTGVTPEAAVEIVREHFVAGRPVERLIDRDMGKVKKEFLHHRTKTREVTRALAAKPPPTQGGGGPG